LAEKLDLPLLGVGVMPAPCREAALVLMLNSDGLSLQKTGKGAPGPVKVEIGSPAMRHRRRGGQNELLGRAVGVGKKPLLGVLDATAGLGRDSFVLADLGCQVILCERHPVIIEMLASGLSQASRSGDDWLLSVAGRLQLCPGDARQQSESTLQGVDVIYLDPMFPVRGKSASVKKEMALFQELLEVGDASPDGDALLLWSLERDVARVVVKRPVKAPVLAQRKPSHVISGKAVRYDVYVKHALD